MIDNMMNVFLKTILLLICFSGWTSVASHGVILQYHHISTETPAATSLSPELFEAQLDALEKGGFNVVSLPMLLADISSGREVKDKTVAITFDDGYESIYSTVLPMLQQRGWPFTVFIAPDAIEKQHLYSMSWEQVQMLSKAGVTIANHSFSHQHLLRKLANEDDNEWQSRVLADIVKAEQLILEKTAQSHQILAWPYGEYSPLLARKLAEAGYTAVAQHSGVVHSKSDFLALPRFTFNQAYADVDDFIIKASSLPLVVTQTEPEAVIIDDAFFKLKLVFENNSYDLNKLSCYASDQGKQQTVVDGNQVDIIFKKIPQVGRSKINCTLAVDNNRFRWFSRLLIRKQIDGQWYKES